MSDVKSMNGLSKWDRLEYELGDIVAKTKDLIKLADEIHKEMLDGKFFVPPRLEDKNDN